MYTLAMAMQADGFTPADVLANVPHDAPAIVVYLLIIGSLVVLWRTHRGSGGSGGRGRGEGSG